MNQPAGWDAQSVTSQHSVCEDSSDESEYSMDYHTERPLSTRSSQVMLEAIDQVGKFITHFCMIKYVDRAGIFRKDLKRFCCACVRGTVKPFFILTVL